MPNESSQNPDPQFELDLCSDPGSPGQSPSNRSNGQRPHGQRLSGASPVRLYFGCCRVYAQMVPPEHVMQGRSDIWRAHCPRCGRLIEVLFQ